MRPIEQRTDLNFHQALRCVEYRLPKQGSMTRNAYIHALALRYGIIGAAACHHLLLSSSDDEESALIESIAGWPATAEEHFRWEATARLSIDASPLLPTTLANQSYQPIVSYLEGYRCLQPLEECLHSAADAYIKENLDEIRPGWGWIKSRKPMKEFRHLAEESIRFATMFFERRQLNLDEVPEIALLGE